jgi:VWFA-related protein
MAMRQVRAGAFLFLFGIWAVPLPAADAEKPPEFGSTVSVVSVPVFVTDRDGQSVSGLGAADFEVRDDKKLVEIVGFQEIDASDPDFATQLADSPAARRQFLLLFDFSFSSIGGLTRARAAAKEFVRSGLAPGDLAAVATLSVTHGLKLLVGFTSDRAQLQKAVDTLGVLQLDRRPDPLGLVYDLTEVGSAVTDVLRPADVVGQDRGFQSAMRSIQLRYANSEQENYRQRVLAFIEGLRQVARVLDALQGRKQVILLSSGFNESVLVGVHGEEARRDAEAVIEGAHWEVREDSRFGDTEVRRQLARTLARFSSSDSVVHSVDLSGLQTARGELETVPGLPVTARAGQESLSYIARTSGGRFFKDTNNVGVALSEVLELSSRYYVLAFEPPDARGAGKFHKLKVKVRGKGLHLSHRSGYFERPPFAERTQMARQFEAAEVIAKGITGGELDVRAMAVPYRSDSGRVTLPVILEVDGTSLLGDPLPPTLSLEVYGYALAPDGRVQDVIAMLANLDVQKVGEKLKRGLQIHGAFNVGAGRHSLRFLVRDGTSGRSGSQWLEVTVPPFEATEGVMLFPPLFMDDPNDWLILQARPPDEGAGTPFEVGGSPFTARARPRLENGRAESLCLLAFDGAAQYDPGASFEIRAQLLDERGAPVPAGDLRISRTLTDDGGFRRFVMSLTPSDLAPGEYTLRARLVEMASGKMSEAYQMVRVEPSRK